MVEGVIGVVFVEGVAGDIGRISVGVVGVSEGVLIGSVVVVEGVIGVVSVEGDVGF